VDSSKNLRKVLRNKQLFVGKHIENNLLDTNEDQLEELSAQQKHIYYSCADIECEAGGLCILDERHLDKRIRCRCPLGRGGFFCEKRKSALLVNLFSKINILIHFE